MQVNVIWLFVGIFIYQFLRRMYRHGQAQMTWEYSLEVVSETSSLAWEYSNKYARATAYIEKMEDEGWELLTVYASQTRVGTMVLMRRPKSKN